MARDSIHQLILDSASQPMLGEGKGAWVFPVSDPRFNSYVLCALRSDEERRQAPRDVLEKRLLASTVLTPVDYGYGGTTLAPVVLQGEAGISLRIRQPGMSLHRLWRKLASESTLIGVNAEHEAYAQVLERIANVPQSSYEDLLRNMNLLTKKGHLIDPIGDNLTLSDNALRWIDTEVPSIDYRGCFGGVSPNHLRSVHQMLSTFTTPFFQIPSGPESAVLILRVSTAQRRISEKLENAARMVPTPFDDAELRRPITGQPVAFDKVRTVDEFSRLPLSQTTRKLRTHLDKLEQHLRISPRDFH